MVVEALNARGQVLLGFVAEALEGHEDIASSARAEDRLDLTIALPSRAFTEEERSRMPTVFSVLRAIVALFKSDEDSDLGLYGAFGYDLAYQFDAVEETLARPATGATSCSTCRTRS